MTNKSYISQSFFVLFLSIILLVPGIIFFFTNSETNLLTNMFRLSGIYAITLLWQQILFNIWKEKLHSKRGVGYKRIFTATELFSFIFALLHPFILYGMFLLQQPLTTFLTPIQQGAGEIASSVALVGLLTFFLNRNTFFQKYARFIQYGNWTVFALAIIHSVSAPTTSSIHPLKLLYFFYAGSVILSLIIRRQLAHQPHSGAKPALQDAPVSHNID